MLLELLDRPATTAAESVALLDALVSPYVGIVRGVEEVVGEPFDIRLPNLCCETGYLGPQQTGAGSAAERTSARAAAIGEAVERYAACESDHVDAVVASARELGARALAPERFALHSAAQYAQAGFPYQPFTSDTPVAWLTGFSLADGEPALLPAQLVYLHWNLRDGEQRIARSTSSGLACRPTLEESLLSGLLELLERDAFMLTWKARLSWPRLTWRPGSSLGAFERRFVAPAGLSVAALDLSAVWDVPT
ncbi:MAG TPA: YcaO-like family protein, partial [Gaiellaceae bacterium]|nr:YcaO-like family protein [Gaiellaceae bacterium]